MDPPAKPTRRWYRKKRWQVVLAFWLLLPLLYLLGDGLNQYCIGRGWGSPAPRGLYAPIKWVADKTGHRLTLIQYRTWVFRLAKRHAAEARED